MKQYLICLDVGGTEIKAAPVTPGGTLLLPVQNFCSGAKGSLAEILAHFEEIIRSCMPAEGCLSGLRFGFPGPFDYENGICLMQGLDKYDALYQFDLRKYFSERFLLPADQIRFCNDISAFALGEMHFGKAGKQGKALFVCIGTGCGSAFSVNGKLVGDETENVPPFGYIYCTPFHDSCIDDYISKRGLLRLTGLRLGTALEGKELARRTLDGDPAAAACFLEFGRLTAEALTPFLDSFRPDTLCIGGGITRSAQLFLSPLEQACEKREIRFYVTAETSQTAIRGCSTL